MIPQTPPGKAIPQANSNFSPVILPKSPAAASPHKNLTGLPRVARDIAADLYNNIQKWNEQHLTGSKVVQNIATVKADSEVLYPEDLEEQMKMLFDIVQNLSIYSNALVFLSSQMQALVKLHKEKTPLFISLTVEQLADLVKSISDAYKTEFVAKQYILENIAHSKSKQEIMFFASSWNYQRNITNNIHLKLETILTETGHRKIT
ncbi:PREDICTED: cyclin-dependent kinase 2-interacting protein-like [Nicrophorus vespilloides]|uniref:Cyclin-dependent kinase 2-interacting protein-like n=1 Tax=Nicrophorus vespilloides TaxID=110193 RepID=A0ABM1MQB9_NICVS|nr:PREDICTED: cyclin-dependent kinase 2-interacting protein-like [Nicrophorus vespilloides]